MPISREQFDMLGDYSGLEELHVYGDLLNLYSLPVHTTIAEGGSLFSRIRSIDARLLTVYASYVLARAGFYSQVLARGDFPQKLNTTRFGDSDWLENLILFEHEEEGYRDEWEMYFENEKNETIKILFVTLLRADMKGDEAAHLLKLFDTSVPNYVIVHPRLSRKARKTFKKAKERMNQTVGEDVVLSTGQFVSKFIPDESRRAIVEANWEGLRERILGMLQEEWPILVHSIHDQLLHDAQERLRRARLKYELEREFEESIKDVGISCESLLQVFHSIYPKKHLGRMGFNDLLCNLRDEIIEEFGQDIYNDLDLIREWRNKVLHPPVHTPDADIALKIITKAELYHRLFHSVIKKQRPSKYFRTI